MDKQAILDETAHVVEETLDVIENIPKQVEVVKNNPYLLAGVALFSLSTGAYIGYQIAKRHLQPKYEAIARAEIEEAKEYYSGRYKKGDYESPISAARKLIGETELEAREALEQYKGHGKSVGHIEIEEDEHSITVKASKTEQVDGDDIEVTEEVTSNIFLNNKPLDPNAFDYDAEVALRTEDKPYVITHDEFFENEPDFENTQLTYFEGDKILADEDSDPVEDVAGIVGEDNLKKFGHGSKDRNTVYIRNPQKEMNIEVVRSFGKFQEEVLGFIQHSDEPRSRHHNRRRGGYDE